MSASEALTEALQVLAEHNRHTPCQGSRHRDRWTSDDHNEREWAAFHCRSLACPVLELCGLYGDEIKASAAVYGGVPRGQAAKTGRPTNRKNPSQRVS